MIDTDIKGFINIIFFTVAVLIIYMSAGKKSTFYFLLLVLAGEIISHVDQIKALATT